MVEQPGLCGNLVQNPEDRFSHDAAHYSFSSSTDQKVSLLLEDITMSIDVNEIYSKLKMNLGAANIDHVVRARYVVYMYVYRCQ